MEQNLIRTEKGTIIVKITPEIVERVIAISDDDVKWLKISEVGFMDGPEFLTSELVGKIVDIHLYWICWTDGEPEKIPFVSLEDEPEGFELRTDIKILLVDGEVVALSLAKSSSHAFSRYLRRVETLRLQVHEVLTRMTTRSVVNREKQKFTIIDFRPVLPNNENPKQRMSQQSRVSKKEEPPEPAYCQDWEKESERETDIPF